MNYEQQINFIHVASKLQNCDLGKHLTLSMYGGAFPFPLFYMKGPKASNLWSLHVTKKHGYAFSIKSQPH